MTEYLLAIDQGTTGSTSLVMSLDGRTLGRHSVELPQHFPEPAWVEHDPEEIWATVQVAVSGALQSAGIKGSQIAALGLTNQRETTLIWDRASGRPIRRAIVWQDRRTSEVCRRLTAEGHAEMVRELTGLVIDPYFSATKIAWMLDAEGMRSQADAGQLAFGTVDSFLIWKLGGGVEGGRHCIEISNASRTSLMNLDTGTWDDRLCELFRVPRAILPEIVASAGLCTRTRGFAPLPDGVPITGVAGDQQAALFGQACFTPGDAKCTYGTGAFLVVNTGERRAQSRHGLVSTVAWRIGPIVTYALEGSCFIAGAAVQWLRDGLRLIRSSSEVEALAASVASSDGVVFVPALSGLGAPHWDASARGLISGLTRGSGPGHIARATLEAIAFQVDDLIGAVREDLGGEAVKTDDSDRMRENGAVQRMRVDGGAAQNDLLMQFQSDISAVRVERPLDLESTARGAALLAAIGAGLLGGLDEVAARVVHPQHFEPQMTPPVRSRERARWRAAVQRARSTEVERSLESEIHGN